jgi:hypothetical protein
MRYEIWDVRSGNAVGEYDSEGQAVLALRRFFAKYPTQELDDLVLIEVDRLGSPSPVAQGRNEMVRLIEHGGTVSA